MTERENCIRMYKRLGPEWVPCEHMAIQTVSVSCIHDRADEGKDWFGVTWHDSVPDVSHRLLDDVTRWREVIRFPDVYALDWAGSAKRDCAGLDRENRLIWAPLRVGPFERMHSFMGFEDTLIDLCVEPEALQELIDAYIEYRLKVMDKVIEYYDPDILSAHDDYGTQLSTFMAPELWRKFFKGGIKKLVDKAHEHGKIFVMHCCGKVDALVGDFVELEIDAWDSVQPCCDLKGVYERYGKDISFLPGMDLQRLAICAPDEARQIVRDTIDLLGRNGNVMPRVEIPRAPDEVRVAVRDEVERYGRTFYR